MKNLFYYNTQIGKIGLVEERGLLTNLLFVNTPPPKGCKIQETELLTTTCEQINAYLGGNRKKFTVPINPPGDKIMQQVLIEVINIPYGETISYKELANRLGFHSKTITSCLYKNPLPIIIPCHRVISLTEKVTGYVGDIATKKFLLETENPYIFNEDYKRLNAINELRLKEFGWDKVIPEFLENTNLPHRHTKKNY